MQLIARVFSFLQSKWRTLFQAFAYHHYKFFIFVLLHLEDDESVFPYLWTLIRFALITLLSISLEYLFTFIFVKVSHSVQTAIFKPVYSIFYVLMWDCQIMSPSCSKFSIDTWSWLRVQWLFVSFYWVLSVIPNALCYRFVVSKLCLCFIAFL